MFVVLLILLLVSSAVTIKRDKSILFSRIVIQSLLFGIYLVYNHLYFISIDKGVGIYGGLLNVTTITQSFSVFIFIISGIILSLTGFYPRKVSIYKGSSLINPCLVGTRHLISKLFRRETLINFGLSILLFFSIKWPANFICSQLNTPWLYLIILGITSVLYCIIIRILWDRELYKPTQLMLIGLSPVLISVLMQWVDIDFIRVFTLVFSSVLMSVAPGGYSATRSYMNPSGNSPGQGGSAGQGGSGADSSRSTRQGGDSQDNRGIMEGKGKKRVRSDSPERVYPNRRLTTVNEPVQSLELNSTHKSNPTTPSKSSENNISQQEKTSKSIILSQLPLEERFKEGNTSSRSNNTNISIITQLPLEERFNVASTSDTSNQYRPVSSQQPTNVNREAGSQQVTNVEREVQPQQVVNVPPVQQVANVPPVQQVANVPPVQQVVNVPPVQQVVNLPPIRQLVDLPPTQVGTENGTGYGDYYANLNIDARLSVISQRLFTAGYYIGCPNNKEAGRRMADHLLFLARLGRRPDHESFTPVMLQWLYDWSYHNDREFHDTVFFLGWRQPSYRRFKLNGTIRDKLTDLD